MLIDGIDVASLPLGALRRALVLVPQEPHLFRGTLRFNLDPWQEHSDEALQATLTMLGLDTKLDTSISENGDNLSAGQRQLLCVCRALLVSRRIICVDEATASVEYGISVLKTPLLMVMGHSGCGAVTAAMDANPLTPSLERLIQPIRDNIRGSRDLEEAVRCNALATASTLIERSTVLADAKASGALKLVVGVFQLTSGVVTLIE